jgi:hypothetical protein
VSRRDSPEKRREAACLRASWRAVTSTTVMGVFDTPEGRSAVRQAIRAGLSHERLRVICFHPTFSLTFRGDAGDVIVIEGDPPTP